jgi:ribosomal-protein-alanine N-acetyltransferase
VPLALRAPRLLLREWRDDDIAPFAAMSADPEGMRYLPFLDRAAAEAWVARMRAHFEEHGFGNFVVEVPGEASFIGVVGLNWVRWNLAFTPAVEAGWRLAPSYWGKGHALEAARAAIEDGFGRIGLAEIVAYTVPANRASWTLMQRLGMTRDPAEDFDHPSFPAGHPMCRHVLYRLRRRSF